MKSIHHHLKKNPLPVVFFTIFVDLLGFGILIPVIPQLLANPLSEYFLLPAGMTLQTGYILLGFLTASFSLAQFVASPILGQLSDKYGRKPILAISLFGTCLSYVIFALGIIFRNLPILFAARIFDGITGGNISVAQAAIADVTKPADRAKNFGLIGAAFGLGFIIGPFIGGKLSDPSILPFFNVTTPFWFAAGLSFLNTLSVIFLFPETMENIKRDTKMAWNRAVLNVTHAWKLVDLRTLFITSFLINAGFSFFVGFFSVFLINRFNFNQGNIGDFFAYVGICIAVTQGFTTARVGKLFKDYQIVRVGVLMTGLSILLYFVPTQAWQLLFVVPIFATFNGLAQANLPALISRNAGAEVQGEVLGINASLQALGQGLPSLLAGFIAASLTAEAPIIVSSIVIILAAVYFWIFFKPNLVTQFHEVNSPAQH